MVGKPFEQIEAAVQEALEAQEHAKHEYDTKVQAILDRNRLDASLVDDFVVVRVVPTEDFLGRLSHSDVIEFQARVRGAGGAGLVASAVAARTVGKVVGKSAFKLATKAVVKLVLGRTAGALGGAAGGAATGAAIGSIIPGVGTVVGGIAGGVAGAIITGVAVDASLLALEEHISRDKYREEIVLAISEAHAELKAALHARPEDANADKLGGTQTDSSVLLAPSAADVP